MDAAEKQDDHDTLGSQCRDEDVGHEYSSSIEERTSYVDVALPSIGEVKISQELLLGSWELVFQLHRNDQIVKIVLDTCLQLYTTTLTLIFILELWRDVSHLEFDTDSNNNSQEQCVKIKQTDDVSKESETNVSPSVRRNKDPVIENEISVRSFSALAEPEVPSSLPCPSDQDEAVLASKKVRTNGFLQRNGGKDPEDPISTNSGPLVVIPKCEFTTENDARAVHNVNDLAKGEERVNISWVNNTTNDLPPPFHYIPQNLVYRDAYVNFSLSRIGNEDCCSACKGNCVLSSKPCPCTNKTGGEFAFTAHGLLKEAFLDECIAINRDFQNYFYCKACPFEQSKNDDCLEPCKGHLKQKFIKECWSKCGCGKHCGNRVVQRGISCKLQVIV